MIEYVSGCVDCGFPCMGTACPNHTIPEYHCDECGDDGDIYEYEGEELCADCLLRRHRKVGE